MFNYEEKEAFRCMHVHKWTKSLINEHANNARLFQPVFFTALLIESMLKVNASCAAEIVETATSMNLECTLFILEQMNTESLARLLIEIARLPSTPERAARLLDKMDLDKAVKVVKFIVELEAFEDLSEILHDLSSVRLNEILEKLTIVERTQLLPHLKPDTIARIHPQLLCLPDLMVKSVDLKPSKPVVGKECVVNVRIMNIGKADAGLFEVSLKVNNTAVQTRTVEGLKVNETADLSFSCEPQKQGDYELTVVIDPDGKIYELNKDNNILCITTTVKKETNKNS